LLIACLLSVCLSRCCCSSCCLGSAVCSSVPSVAWAQLGWVAPGWAVCPPGLGCWVFTPAVALRLPGLGSLSGSAWAAVCSRLLSGAGSACLGLGLPAVHQGCHRPSAVWVNLPGSSTTVRSGLLSPPAAWAGLSGPGLPPLGTGLSAAWVVTACLGSSAVRLLLLSGLRCRLSGSVQQGSTGLSPVRAGLHNWVWPVQCLLSGLSSATCSRFSLGWAAVTQSAWAGFTVCPPTRLGWVCHSVCPGFTKARWAGPGSAPGLSNLGLLFGPAVWVVVCLMSVSTVFAPSVWVRHCHNCLRLAVQLGHNSVPSGVALGSAFSLFKVWPTGFTIGSVTPGWAGSAGLGWGCLGCPSGLSVCLGLSGVCPLPAWAARLGWGLGQLGLRLSAGLPVCCLLGSLPAAHWVRSCLPLGLGCSVWVTLGLLSANCLGSPVSNSCPSAQGCLSGLGHCPQWGLGLGCCLSGLGLGLRLAGLPGLPACLGSVWVRVCWVCCLLRCLGWVCYNWAPLWSGLSAPVCSMGSLLTIGSGFKVPTKVCHTLPPLPVCLGTGSAVCLLTPQCCLSVQCSLRFTWLNLPSVCLHLPAWVQLPAGSPPGLKRLLPACLPLPICLGLPCLPALLPVCRLFAWVTCLLSAGLGLPVRSGLPPFKVQGCLSAWRRFCLLMFVCCCLGSVCLLNWAGFTPVWAGPGFTFRLLAVWVAQSPGCLSAPSGPAWPGLPGLGCLPICLRLGCLG